MRWVEHVARMGTGEVHAEFWRRNLSERYQVEDLGVDMKIILKCL
jgi:hypothetical protein